MIKNAFPNVAEFTAHIQANIFSGAIYNFRESGKGSVFGNLCLNQYRADNS